MMTKTTPDHLKQIIVRLTEHGVQVCTESELLSVVTGREVRSDSLEQVRERPGTAYANFGRATGAKVLAALELGRRTAAGPTDPRIPISGPSDAARLLIPHLRHRRTEVFAILPLDAKGRARAVRIVSVGSLTASIVHPREVFNEALAASAASIIVAHNHPSGDPTPSPEDIAVTRKLVRAGEVMGIPVVDHLVIGDSGVTSLKEQGLMGDRAEEPTGRNG
jgi:DNA repair protein RadC